MRLRGYKILGLGSFHSQSRVVDAFANVGTDTILMLMTTLVSDVYDLRQMSLILVKW